MIVEIVLTIINYQETR